MALDFPSRACRSEAPAAWPRAYGRDSAAARIVAAIKADGRVDAVCIDDMQLLLDLCDARLQPDAD